MKQTQPNPSAYPFDEMTKKEREKIWVGHRCRWEGRLGLLDLPPRFIDAKLSDFPSGLQAFAGRSVFITGVPGTGKTHLLAALAKKQLSIGADEPTIFKKGTCEDIVYARFINIVDLLALFRSTMATHAPTTEQELFDDYADCRYLFLDDLGVQCNTDWVSQTIYRIIDYRYANLLPICITSNCTIGEIAQNNERVARRISEICQIIEM